jgi:hypothetical protein
MWWQRREFVKGEQVVPPGRTAFSIQALAANFRGSQTVAAPKEISWQRPHRVKIYFFFERKSPVGPGSLTLEKKTVAVQIITKDPIRKNITHRSLIDVEKTTLKDLTEQTGPPLLPPSSQRSGQPPSRMNAGTKPLVFNPTLDAVANL